MANDDDGPVYALQQSHVDWVNISDDVGAIYLDVANIEDRRAKPEVFRFAVTLNRDLARKLRDQLNSFIGGN